MTTLEVLDAAPCRRAAPGLLQVDLSGNVYARAGRRRGAVYRCGYCRAVVFIVAMHAVAAGLWAIDVLVTHGVTGVLPGWPAAEVAP